MFASTTSRLPIFAAVAVLVLATLAACSSATPTPTPTATATATPEPTPTPTQPVPTPTPTPREETAEDVALAFVDELLRGEYATAAARFDETMTQVFPVEALQQTWETLLQQVGAFQAVQGTSVTPSEGYEIVVVTAAFETLPIDIQVTLDGQRRVAGLFFRPADQSSAWQPPAYANVESFTESEVVVGSAPWELPGTLTMPNGDGPFPAVVLVHGSGPNDRDETIGPNKTFKDLAWGLASRGIAVLRYEKRTREHADAVAANIESLTIRDETIDDAVAAATLLSGLPGIDPTRVFVLGHSLGGMVGPVIASELPELAGLVLMAAPTRPLQDLIVEQTNYLAALDGSVSPEEQAELDEVARQAEKVTSLDIAPGETPLGLHRAYWESLAAVDQVATAQALDLPMLFLQGERDYQVTMEDFAAWEAALGGDDNVTLTSYPALNHLFIAGEGPSSPQEYLQPAHVAQEVVEDIAGWIAGL